MSQYTHFASYGGVFFRKSQSYMKVAFKNLGLSFVEGIVLINACENPGIIQEKIAFNLALDDASVARSLKQMEQSGLVSRRVDEQNQRTKMVFPEPAGTALKHQVDAVMEHWSATLLESFSAREQDEMVRVLQILREKSLTVSVEEAIRALPK